MHVVRRIRLRREGWYYLGVLVFIIGGASLRQVNLLVILAGLMIAPLIFNWRLASAMLRGLTVQRRLPRRVAAGDPFVVELTVANPRPHLDAWVVVVEDVFTHEGSARREGLTKVETVFPRVNVGASSGQAYRCQLPRRGRYRFGPLRLSCRFPLGLVQAEITIESFDTMIVCPQWGKLARNWDLQLESDRVGAQRARRQQGLVQGDFYGLRDWRPGDTRRWIHWRTSARRGQLTVRQFERQRNRDVALVLDLWQPEEPSAEQLDHVETAVSAAATLVAEICKRGGSRLLVAVAGAEAKRQSAAASLVFMNDVLEYLAVVAAGPAKGLPALVADTLVGQAVGAQVWVLSTRSREAAAVDESPDFQNGLRLAPALAESTWIDVAGPNLARFFTWEEA